MKDITNFNVVCENYRGDIHCRHRHSMNCSDKNYVKAYNSCMLERVRDYFFEIKPADTVKWYKNKPQMLKINIEPGLTLLIFKSLKFRLMVSNRKKLSIINVELIERNLPKLLYIENFEIQSQTIVFQLPFNSVNLYKLPSNFFVLHRNYFLQHA